MKVEDINGDDEVRVTIIPTTGVDENHGFVNSP
jgi:hypothetical protein